MATRTGVAGTFTDGPTLSAANLNSWGAGLIARCKATADQTGITTAADLVGDGDSSKLSLTITPAASRDLKISFSVMVGMTSSSGADDFAITVLKDGTQIGEASQEFVSTGDFCTISTSIVDVSPTNASHIYKLQGQRSNGTGTFKVTASATNPSWFTIEDVGPTF